MLSEIQVMISLSDVEQAAAAPGRFPYSIFKVLLVPYWVSRGWESK